MAKEKIVSLVAGGAGFIGVNLSRKLIQLGQTVVIGDNLSLGTRENISKWISADFTNFLDVDISCEKGVEKLFDFAIQQYGHIDRIWHLAANSDIPSGVEDPCVDLKDTFMTTFWLLAACKRHGVKKFNFASSSAVYGDWGESPLTESLGPLTPISNYGAMKLASEAQICAARESFLDEANIFRFPNVVGVPATHGVILDFIKKLHEDRASLHVLGDGSQRKSYLHVRELVSAMIHVVENHINDKKLEIVNVGCDDDGILVRDIAEIVVSLCAPEAEIIYGLGRRGWVGDVPKFSYDISRLRALGWTPDYSSREAVVMAAKEIYSQLSE